MRMACMLVLTGGLSSAFAAEQTSFSKLVAVGPNDHISVSNVAGSVVVTAWDRPEVDVQGVLGGGVERVDVQRERGSLDIRVVLRRDSGRGLATLRIRVPSAAWLEISTISASQSTSALRGKIRLDTISGAIRSDLTGSDYEAESVSGSITVMGNGSRARVRATSVSGGITISGVAGEVEARSTSGRLDIGADAAHEVRLDSVSGAITYRGGLYRDGSLEVETVSGRVQMLAEAAGGYRYNLTSYSGHITSCFPGADELDERRGRKRLSATQGQGAASVSAKSMSGSISLCDR